MASQLDLDQGGTTRHWIRKYLGPSVGWVYVPDKAILSVVTTGTTTLLPGTSLVLVDVAAVVTIQLPSSIASLAGAQTIPYGYAMVPITIIDLGGHARNFNITILPFGTETIDGLASITITANYGAFTLNP